MSALDDAIHKAAKSGRLHGLTLFQSSAHGWQANARWNGSEGWTVVVGADPVAAMIEALEGQSNFNSTNGVGGSKIEAPPAPPSGGIFD